MSTPNGAANVRVTNLPGGSGFTFTGSLRSSWVSNEIKVPVGSHFRVRSTKQSWSGARGPQKTYLMAVQHWVNGRWSDIVSRKATIGAGSDRFVIDAVLKLAGRYRLRLYLRPDTASDKSTIAVEGRFTGSPDRSPPGPDTPQYGPGAESLEEDGVGAEDAAAKGGDDDDRGDGPEPGHGGGEQEGSGGEREGAIGSGGSSSGNDGDDTCIEPPPEEDAGLQEREASNEESVAGQGDEEHEISQ